MDESQCSMDFLVDEDSLRVDPAASHRVQEDPAEHIISNLADKCSLLSIVLKHGEDIARRTARIHLQQRIALRAVSGFRKVDQQFTKSNYIICFIHSILLPEQCGINKSSHYSTRLPTVR